MKRILVADDDLEWLELVAMRLRTDGHEVYKAFNVLEAYRLYCEKQPDIVVLDVAMPDANGLSLTKQMLSANPRTPVLIMSGLTDAVDVEAGYNTGARNYFKKPFNASELVACIRNMEVQATYSFGCCTFNPRTRCITVGSKEEYTLSQMHADLLSMLCRNIGEPVMRKDIYKSVLGYDPEETRTIDTNMSKLRQLLSGDPSVRIKSCYGEGYQLVVRSLTKSMIEK